MNIIDLFFLVTALGFLFFSVFVGIKLIMIASHNKLNHRFVTAIGFRNSLRHNSSGQFSENANSNQQPDSSIRISYKPEGADCETFKKWLHTTLKDLFADNYRKLLKEQAIVDTTTLLYYLNIPEGKEMDNLENNYSIAEINQAITSLSKEYQGPFLLYIQGYTYNEISERLFQPLGTVKSKIFFARQHLQKKLNEKTLITHIKREIKKELEKKVEKEVIKDLQQNILKNIGKDVGNDFDNEIEKEIYTILLNSSFSRQIKVKGGVN